jgi:hypothetical protein
MKEKVMSTTEKLTVAGNATTKIDEASVRAHVMEPPQLKGVTTYQGEVGTRPSVEQPASLLPKHLDVAAFGNAVHNYLKDIVVGYAMQLRQGGNPISSFTWNWAKTPVDGDLGFNLNRQMHIASVSKLMTAIGLTKMIDDLHLPLGFDTKIKDFLPTYWKKSPGIGNITFRHLLTHTSGFPQDGTAMTFPLMKSNVANYTGTAGGSPAYSNMNFSLCRVLMPILHGNVAADFPFPATFLDHYWDITTANVYNDYMQNHVFIPSGVLHATLNHDANCALAYPFPAGNSHGWDSGNLVASSGGDGWHMSVNQVLIVMNNFRRKGTIMSTAQAQSMLTNMFGIDVAQFTEAGTLYYKNGLWADSNDPAVSKVRAEQCVAFFLPEDMELVVFANSLVPGQAPPKTNGAVFSSKIAALYVNNLK